MPSKYYEYNKNFRRTTYKIFNFYFNKEKDADIIEFIKNQPQKTEFIKKIIRKAMEEDN